MFALILNGCVGQLSLEADEEVSPGAALGFESINYVSERRVAGVFQQEILDIDANGRTTLVIRRDETAAREPFRFLPDDALLEVRRNFAASSFFVWADSTYGEGTDRTQSIVYEVGGRVAELVRHDDAPVPPEIQILMDQLEGLLLDGLFGAGQELAVETIVAGSSTRIDRREFVVIKSQEALLDLLFRMGSIEVSVLPRIDYEREMLACVFLGDSADRTVAIAVVKPAYRYGGRIQLLYERRDVEPECDRSARPFLVAKLPRANVPVELFEAIERDSARCGGD